MNWSDTKVLVTGGAGVIGRALIGELTHLKADVMCIDREPQTQEMSSVVEYCRQDIAEMNLQPIVDFNPEIIFHLAASFERTEETPEFWDVNFKDNIVVTHRIIGVAREIPNLRKFIFASSYLIYDSFLYKFDAPQDSIYMLNENDRLETRNLTGTAKYFAEKELEFMGATHGKFISGSARIFRVYGRGSRDIISRWVRIALRNEKLLLYKKYNWFDYVFSDDVALGLIKMSEIIEKDEIMNLGSGKSRRVEEVVDIIKKYISQIKVKEIDEGDYFEASGANMSRFRELVHWQPQTSLEEGIKEIVKYEQKQLENSACMKEALS